jgi:hypothetical protein
MHMETQQTQEHQRHAESAYTDTILDHLVERYLARTTVPGTDATPLTIERFHRLYCCIMAEGYGQ